MEEDMNPQVQPVTKTEVFPKVFSTPQKEIITEPTPKIDPFENEMSKFVYYRTYSRWDDTKGRRETWEETVERCVIFLKKSKVHSCNLTLSASRWSIIIFNAVKCFIII